jgi:inner membrane protein
MLILGHVGITVGAGALLDFGLRKKYGRAIDQTSADTGRSNITKKPHTADPPPGFMAKLAVFMKHMDYRLLLVGSMLPDLIDKPLGHIFFVDFFDNQGRLFAHSLLFLIIMVLIGLYLHHRWKQQWLLILSFGTAMHLLTDEIWLNPHTIFWPVLGWSFEQGESGNFWLYIWDSFLEASPYVIATETIGIVFLVVFLIILLRRKKLWAFIRYGRL